jgi:hypothetical protein
LTRAGHRPESSYGTQVATERLALTVVDQVLASGGGRDEGGGRALLRARGRPLVTR